MCKRVFCVYARSGPRVKGVMFGKGCIRKGDGRNVRIIKGLQKDGIRWDYGKRGKDKER